MTTQKIYFTSPSDKQYWMGSNGFYCGFNMPNALHGEKTFGLPPYNKRKSFLVDQYPACPTNWMRSEGRVSSYFVPVVEGKGMWLDLNRAVNENSYHVAAVISVQGINAITGLPCEDTQLEQYIEECPKHKIKFGPDRFCKECNFKWPKQNYLCTTGTPNGMFWLDGFRTAEGCVRQYILTAEKMRGVAANVIGKDRVFAIGISFFLSHDKKPEPIHSVLRCGSTSSGHDYTWDKFFFCNNIGSNLPKKEYYEEETTSVSPYYPTITTMGLTKASKSFDSFDAIHCSSVSENESTKDSGNTTPVLVKGAKRKSDSPYYYAPIKMNKLEVGAGAKISQAVYDDPETLDFWRNDPESILCINYCTEVNAREIMAQGKIDLEGSQEGFLQDIPIGN